MPRRTKEEAARTRALILKTAEKFFYQHGVVQTSLQEIAVGAGVTRGAIYWHFRDKADLLWSIADNVFLPYEDMMDRIVASETEDPLELLFNDMVESLNAITNNASRRRVFTILTQRCEYIEEMAKLNRRNSAMRDRLQSRLVALFEKVVARGNLAPAWTARTAAMALQTFMIGWVHVEMEYPSPSKKRDRERNEMIADFFKALRN